MRFYERHAPTLVMQALNDIDFCKFKHEITHLMVVSCTGLYFPGIDIDIVNQFELGPEVERTIIGFMGCYAAINAFKLARHIVKSEPYAKVIIVNIGAVYDPYARCRRTRTNTLLFYLGRWLLGLSRFRRAIGNCVTKLSFAADPTGGRSNDVAHRATRLRHDALWPGATHASAWAIRQYCYLGRKKRGDVRLWAVHPGGRSILDAVGSALDLDADALSCSRDVLRRFGNMSSATVPFVLRAMLDRKLSGLGCGMAFGPGLTAESMIFELPS